MKLSRILLVAFACSTSFSALAANKEVEEGCRTYGQLAAAIATDRASGVPFATEAADIVSRFSASAARAQMRDLVEFLYKSPPGKSMSAEGAMSAMYFDCVSRVESARAGGGGTKSAAEIEALLTAFPTFTGEKLTSLLKKYGLHVVYVERRPLSTMAKREGDQPGDVLLTIQIEGHPKRMPCGLQQWLSSGVDMAEVVARRGALLTDVEDLDPVLYWAKTSKCSSAYDLSK